MSDKTCQAQRGEIVSEDTPDTLSPLNGNDDIHERNDKKHKWVTVLSSLIAIMVFIGVLMGFIDVDTLDKLSTCVNTLRLQNLTSPIDFNTSSSTFY
jgi:hypothetical protein